MDGSFSATEKIDSEVILSPTHHLLLVFMLGLNIMTTWRLAPVYCAKHLLHFDEARQRREREEGEGERGREYKRKRERVRAPWPGWMC